MFEKKRLAAQETTAESEEAPIKILQRPAGHFTPHPTSNAANNLKDSGGPPPPAVPAGIAHSQAVDQTTAEDLLMRKLKEENSSNELLPFQGY